MTQRQVKRVPVRIYRCPECGRQYEYRWYLAKHLYDVEGYGKREAKEVASECEYWLRPKYEKI